MKIEIETYKGQLIEYDDEYDKFLCEISIEDKYKKTQRSSLKAVRTEIDAFVKLNLEFKPFKALEVDKWGSKSFNTILVKGVRTDGKFIVGTERSSSNSHYDKEDIQRIMMYDSEIVAKAKQYEKEKDEVVSKCNKLIAELCKKLVPVDLSKYSM